MRKYFVNTVQLEPKVGFLLGPTYVHCHAERMVTKFIVTTVQTKTEMIKFGSAESIQSI